MFLHYKYIIRIIIIMFILNYNSYGFTHFGWGDNSIGQIGDSTTTDRLTPKEVTTADWKFISGGYDHSLAIKNDGTLWAWGGNSKGQLGDGTTQYKLFPVKIGNDNSWVMVSAGEEFSLGLKSDGTIWSWGYYGNGRLGTGAESNQLSPVKIGTATNWKHIVAGRGHAHAIKTDGTLWSWGYNYYGAVGDGTNTTRTTPVKIGTATNWKTVYSSSSSQFSLAIKTDGTLWAWGYNGYGQLGDGSTSNRKAPVKIGTATNWKKVATGGVHTIAINTSGNIFGWGYNFHGELGDGSQIDRTSPYQLSNLSSVMDISCGSYHSLAVKTDSSLYATGINEYGEVGDGTTSTRYTFKLIASGTKFGFLSAGATYSLSLSSTSNPIKSIDCDIEKNSFVKGEYLNVEYLVTNGPLNSGNNFKIQVSNSSGNFSNPLVLKSISGTTSGTTIIKLPDTLTNGTGYRLRVNSTSPAITGNDNGSNISITSPPVTLLTPNNLTQHTSMPIFKWQAVSGGTNYRIQVFKDPLMDTLFFGEAVGNQTQSPSNDSWLQNWSSVAYNDTIFWSVRYYNGQYWSDYSPAKAVIKVQGSAPVLSVSADTIIVSGTGTSILSLTNSGGGYLSWSVPNEWKTPWINMNVQSGELQSNQSVNIQVSGQAPLNRIGNITILSNGGSNKIITVIYTPNVYDFAYVNWLDSQPEVGVGINPINETFSHYDKTSFSIPGASFGLEFEHSYYSPNVNTFRPVEASVGVAWLHNYSFILEKFSDKVLSYYPDGNIGYYKLESNKYKNLSPGNYDSLYLSGNYFYMITKSQVVYKFQQLQTNSTVWYLVSIKDRNNNQLTMTYDSGRRLIKVANPENRFLTFEYYPSNSNWPNFIKYVKDYTNRKVEFIYDFPNNDLIKFINLAGDTTHYSYLADTSRLHLLKKIQLPKGNWIENNYNDKKIASQSVSGLTGSLVVSKQSPTTSQITDQLGNITKIEYDKASFGNVKRVITAKKDTLKYEYADTLNPTLPTKFTDAAGNWVKYQYDRKGNLLKDTKPYSIETTYEYNTKNDVTKVIDPLGKVYNYTYNSAGNLITSQTPRASTSMAYNTNGTVSQVTDALSRKVYYYYNSFGDVTQIKDNLNNSVYFTYDTLGRLIKSVNPKNQQSLYEYFINDLPKNNADPNNSKIHYIYDKNENLVALVNQMGDTTKMTYDNNDLLTKTTNPIGNYTELSYNNLGYVSQRKTKNGSVTFTFAYDSTNRLTSIGNAKSVSFEYYKNDLLKRAYTSNGKEMKYEYDSLGRMTKFYNYGTGVTPITYAYDKSGNVTSINYESGKTVQYTYYDDNLLKTVKDWNNRTTTYYYNNDGSINYLTNANGTSTHYAYDNLGRVVSVLNKKSSGDTISYYKNEYDVVGNITSLEYKDPLAMAKMGNSNISSNYNDANQLTSNSQYQYSYDLNGNNTARTGGTNVSYTFNVDDKLTRVVAGSSDYRYEYDLFNQRIGAYRNGVKKNYILNGNNSLSQVLIETDSATGQKTYYIYGSSLISRIKSTGATEWYHSDLRGNVNAITNQSQTVTHKYIYDDYGKVLSKTEPAGDENLYRFLGAYGITYEKEDLYFIRARFYDPTIGRFISEDPKFHTNLYGYGNSSPSKFVDIDGNWSWEINGSGAFVAFSLSVNKDGNIYFSNGISTDFIPSGFMGFTTSTASEGISAIGSAGGGVGGVAGSLSINNSGKIEGSIGVGTPGFSSGATITETYKIYDSQKAGAALYNNYDKMLSKFKPTSNSKHFTPFVANTYKETGKVQKLSKGAWVQFSFNGNYKWKYYKYSSKNK